MLNMRKIMKKNPSQKFRPVGPWDWPETWSKNDKNEKFFKFRTKLFLGSLEYVEYGKISEKKSNVAFAAHGPVGLARNMV